MAEVLEAPLLINTGDTDNPVDVATAIRNGYAPGRELYTYAEADWPRITEEDLYDLLGQDYVGIFKAITRKFLGGAIPDYFLDRSAEYAFGTEQFDFDDSGGLKFTELPNGLIAVGLSDGPTASFKDMALQPMARWMSYLRLDSGDPMTILLATSGDTGPAALAAFAGLSNTDIIALMPGGKGISPFQRAQMVQYASMDNVHVLEIDRDFSGLNDMQMEANAEFDLASVNSVNIARIIAQVPYYVTSYLQAIERSNGTIGDPVDVSIPTGNFGNALSAIIARKMGLRLRNIIVATNENDTLARLFETGEFKLSEFQHTDSSAQDVRMPSNVWRYFSMLFKDNPDKIAEVYRQLTDAEIGSVAIASEIGIDDRSVWDGVLATSIRAGERAQAIRETFQNSGGMTIIDTHTANGVAAVSGLHLPRDNVPTLVMETAKAFKFDRTIGEILGVLAMRPMRFQGYEAAFGVSRHVQPITSQAQLNAYLTYSTNARRKLGR